MKGLRLSEEEAIIVHRGATSPICPKAELSHRISRQSREGFTTRKVPLFSGVENPREGVRMEYHGVVNLSIKSDGEPNGVLGNDAVEVFKGWWCHVIKTGGIFVGLLGRPNRNHLLPGYVPPFPHIISTKKWDRALEQLPEAFQEIRPEVASILNPHLQVFHDTLRSTLGGGCLDSI